MDMIVVGCGRVGAELAYRLTQQGHDVAVIDHNGQAFENLRPDFRGRTLEGEVLNRDVLIRAGIERAHGLAAVTSSDAVNAVVGHIAQTVFEVPYVVVRNYDSRWRLLHEVFGLQVVSPTGWGAQRIEEMMYQQDVRTIFSAGNGEVEIYEFTVSAANKGRMLGDLFSKCECLPIAVSRAGRAMLPGNELKLDEGDVVHLSATLIGIQEIRHRLGRE
jgi:trk system potassium uptake protein TrkA